MTGKVDYTRCPCCKTIFTKDEFTPLTENDKPEERNIPKRFQTILDRACAVSGRISHQDYLDFGSGTGEFTRWLNQWGVAVGVEEGDNLDEYDYLFDIVFMVEVIEHLRDPGDILKQLSAKLHKGGVLYVETTFADDISDFRSHSYVDPNIGHRTIISREGLRLLAELAGLHLAHIVNANVMILKKP